MSRFHIPLRLFAALLLGWLFAFLLNWLSTFPNVMLSLNALELSLEEHLGTDAAFYTEIITILILFPFGLSIVSSLVSRGRRNKEFFLLAVLSGPLFIAGLCLYNLPQAMREDAACPPDPVIFQCMATISVIVFWIIGTLFVLLISLITSPFILIHSTRKHRRKESFHQ